MKLNKVSFVFSYIVATDIIIQCVGVQLDSDRHTFLCLINGGWEFHCTMLTHIVSEDSGMGNVTVQDYVNAEQAGFSAQTNSSSDTILQ